MHKFDKLSILKIHPERYNGAKVERKKKKNLAESLYGWRKNVCHLQILKTTP